MGIDLQESNSSHSESDTGGLSKAKLVENAWIVFGRHWRLGQESTLWKRWTRYHHWVQHALGLGLWVLILYSFTQSKGHWSNITFIFQVPIQSDVTNLKTICQMSEKFHLHFYEEGLGCFPVIKLFWKFPFAEHLQNQFLNNVR